jgi:hypothetical protein
VRFTISVFLILILASTVAASTIELPADPPSTREVILEEMWRIGGEDDEDILMGIIFDGMMDADGNTYLIDRQLSQVLVIDPDGELVTTLGREGEGPGELRNPHGMFLMDGDTIGVIQGFPGRVTIINSDDTPGGTIDIGGPAEEGGFAFILGLEKCGDRLVGIYGRGTMDMEKGSFMISNSLAVMDMEGNAQAEICTHTQEDNFQKPVVDEAANFAEYDSWAASGDRIYTVPERDAYTVRVRDLDGNHVADFTRPFEPRVRTDEDKDEFSAGGANFRVAGQDVEIERKILDTDPAIDDLQVGPDGRLYVRSCWDVRELLPEGTASRFDVISPEGELTEQVTLLIPEFDNEDDRLVFLDGSHFLLIRNFDSAEAAMFAAFGDEEEEDEDDYGDAEPLEVVLYRIP